MINLSDLFGVEAPQIDPVVLPVAEPEPPATARPLGANVKLLREVDLALVRVAFPFAFGDLPDDHGGRVSGELPKNANVHLDDRLPLWRLQQGGDHGRPEPLDPTDPRSWGPPPLNRLTGLCQPILEQDRIQEHRHSRVDQVCPRCRSAEYIDTSIHGGRSARRDCRKCGKFLGFPVWIGRATA